MIDCLEKFLGGTGILPVPPMQLTTGGHGGPPHRLRVGGAAVPGRHQILSGVPRVDPNLGEIPPTASVFQIENGGQCPPYISALRKSSFPFVGCVLRTKNGA